MPASSKRVSNASRARRDENWTVRSALSPGARHASSNSGTRQCLQHLSSLRQRPVHRAGVAADDTSVQQRGDRALRHCGDGHAEDATDLFQPGHGRGGGDNISGGEFA